MTQKEFEQAMLNLGYKPVTDLALCFERAEEKLGLNGPDYVFNCVFEKTKNNVKWVTELVILLNHKIWYYYRNNDELGLIYEKLYKKAYNWCVCNLEGEDAEYFFRVID